MKIIYPPALHPKNRPNTDLKFINTDNLNFHHTAKGVIARYKKLKFILGFTSIQELDESFTEEQFIAFSKTVLNFECAVRKYPVHEAKFYKIITTKEITNDYTPFYKYVPTKIFKRYIIRGHWQLGNIHQYRNIENVKQRDAFEGYSFLNLNINNNIISQVCNTGFNYLIFCGTRSNTSNTLMEQFGETILNVTDVKGFADRISKQINAQRYFIHNVEYNTLKSYVKTDLISNNSVKCNGYILCPEYFDILSEHMIYPSLFVKPEYFIPENEVRIVFEMSKDYFKPYRFKNKTFA